ncbi:S-adenosylmethionine uptake transporter [Paracoccus isoporae]|uniref:S-adenosylmethionine uptake transporter n=1 Tax=Paracoccus isoporae TaxID=591205 RepID=A0A1G7GCQ2_9RHOB|nr:DMT family transporter [Paracoccus isoporae]SDE85871.1 S-adenosylmethionine uptake transporter [Paracoccus isoporae]
MQDHNDTGRILIGIGWMIASLSCFISMAVASRELSANLSTFQILFFRSVVGVVVVALFGLHLLAELRRRASLKLNLLRNAVHFTGQYCWTLAIALMPLAEVIALEFTMPVWVAIFAAVLLGERITRPRAWAILASFVGVLVILRPGIAVFDPAALIVLMAAVSYGLSNVLVKLLTRTCSPAVIVVWMVVMQLPMGLMLAVFDWRPVVAGNLPWIVLAGLSGLGAHYAMARAFLHLDASVAIPIDFLRVPLTALVGYLLYGETVSAVLFAGAAIILMANYTAFRAERTRARLARSLGGPG